MRMRLDELRLLLLTEGGDVLSLAGRAAKNRAIIVCDEVNLSLGDTSEHTIIVCDTHGNPVAYARPSDAVKGTDDKVWTRLRMLYGDSPFDTVLVLLAALLTWKRVVADKDTSPAAQAVIRRYWQVNKDDPTRVCKDAIHKGDAGSVNLPTAFGEGYMRAGYLAPADAPDISAAFRRGKQLIADDPKAIQSRILQVARRAFADAYEDLTRSKLDKAVYPVRQLEPDEKVLEDLLNISNGRRARTDPADETLARLVDYIDSVPNAGRAGIADWVEEKVAGWASRDSFWWRASAAAQHSFEVCILRAAPEAARQALDEIELSG